MSLDVYLELPGPVEKQEEPVERIFVRLDGRTTEVSRDEWDLLHPGREPVVVVGELDSRQVFTANITHNLGAMAKEAGLYEPLWRPEELGATHARDLIEPIVDGFLRLAREEAAMRRLNPENGWGSYEALVEFTRDYLVACVCWPDAEVRVWR